jgi:hypothetical protein
MLQAESVRHAAWGCDWVGTPIPFQRCLIFIIATASKEFRLTAGKFVPVSNKTMINVSFSSNSKDFRFLSGGNITILTKKQEVALSMCLIKHGIREDEKQLNTYQSIFH